MKTVKYGDLIVNVVEPDEAEKYLTESDKDLDFRARMAVKAAIEKAKICKKPIAGYDAVLHKAYLEYPNGEKQYDD